MRRRTRTTRRTRWSMVEWGEESKDEMGSISLIALPQVESDLEILVVANLELARKVMRILAD